MIHDTGALTSGPASAISRPVTIVEAGTCEQIFGRPRHAHTQALLAACPVPDPDEQAERRRQEPSAAE